MVLFESVALLKAIIEVSTSRRVIFFAHIMQVRIWHNLQYNVLMSKGKLYASQNYPIAPKNRHFNITRINIVCLKVQVHLLLEWTMIGKNTKSNRTKKKKILRSNKQASNMTWQQLVNIDHINYLMISQKKFHRLNRTNFAVILNFPN